MAETILTAAVIIIIISLLLVTVRVLKGPTVVDRIVAIDIMTVISIALIVVIANLAQRVIYIDVAIVYGILSFLGVIALARYIERGL